MNKKQMKESLKKLKSDYTNHTSIKLLELVEELVDRIDEESEAPPKDKPFIAYVEDEDYEGWCVLKFNLDKTFLSDLYESIEENDYYLHEIKSWYPMPEEILEKHKEGDE